MIRKELEVLIEQFCDDNGDIINTDELDITVEKFFENNRISYATSQNEMIDSSVFHVYSYSVAWVEETKVNLITYRIAFY